MVQGRRGGAVASSAGIVIGVAQKLDHNHHYIQECKLHLDDIVDECIRFQQAMQQAILLVQQEVEQLSLHPHSDELIPILQAHEMMLNDAHFISQVEQRIQVESINAEWALKKVLKAMGRDFDNIQDAYLRARKEDVYHIGQRIFSCLSNNEPAKLMSQSILIAIDFSPSDIVSMWRAGVAGFVSVQGGEHGHTMIVARGIGLPGMVGARGLFEHVEDGDTLIIDAEEGRWLLSPSTSECDAYIQLQTVLAEEERQLVCQIPKAGYMLPIMANLEFAEEVETAHKYHADGIGLFRTEFLFMQRDIWPDEDEQYQYYAQVVRGMRGKPVTFRLLDLGADKLGDAEDFCGGYHSENPALGLRGIRMLLHRPQLLMMQLRALVRVSKLAEVSILVPMLTTVAEMVEVRALLSLAKKELAMDGEVKLGCMIETPAAVFIAEALSKVSDFFSIGSNDLLQYGLAVDRADEHVSYLYDENHPMLLRLIRMTVDAAHGHGIPVSICGELAANPQWTKTFLDMKMSSLSMSVRHMLAIRKQLQALS